MHRVRKIPGAPFLRPKVLGPSTINAITRAFVCSGIAVEIESNGIHKTKTVALLCAGRPCCGPALWRPLPQLCELADDSAPVCIPGYGHAYQFALGADHPGSGLVESETVPSVYGLDAPDGN